MFKLFFDGAASPNPGIMGAGASLVDPMALKLIPSLKIVAQEQTTKPSTWLWGKG